MREARARSRLRQIESLKQWIKPVRRTTAELATILLQMERLSDALAEDEFGDLGVDERAAKTALADLQLSMRR